MCNQLQVYTVSEGWGRNYMKREGREGGVRGRGRGEREGGERGREGREGGKEGEGGVREEVSIQCSGNIIVFILSTEKHIAVVPQ